MTNPLEIPRITLNSGYDIPQLGFGVFKVDPDETERLVSEAFAAGYRHIDTAAVYGNEEGVGRAIAASGLAREELFITTKLWNDDQGTDSAVAAANRSLDLLGLDHVDLYLIHWPNPAADRYVESWRALESIRDAGRARSIGVSNFLIEHLERLLAETETVPAVNQIEIHPAFQQRETVEFGRRHGIATEAWGPLGQGKYPLFEEPALVAAADAHGVSPAQIVLRWHLAVGHIVFPKSSTPERIRQNIDLFSFELSVDEVESISALDRGLRVGRHPNDEI